MIIHIERVNTSITVPGQMCIKVFNTKRVSKLILFSAPILREEASVNSLLWSNITLAMRYSLMNIGIDRSISTGTGSSLTVCPSYSSVFHMKKKESPGIGWTAQMRISRLSWKLLFHEIAIRQSSTQLSMANNYLNREIRFVFVRSSIKYKRKVNKQLQLVKK